MDAIRAEAPDTIVVMTADNGAWQDAYPDAGTVPFRGEKGSAFEGGWRVPGVMWWPGHIPAGVALGEMMSHIDCWSTLAAMAGITPPPVGEMMDNNGKPIYFDSIDNSAWILGKAKHSARNTWVYIDGEEFHGVRCRRGRRSQEPRSQDRLEIPLHGQGYLAGREPEPCPSACGLLPDHGPVREVRHALQRRRVNAANVQLAGQMVRARTTAGLWL